MKSIRKHIVGFLFLLVISSQAIENQANRLKALYFPLDVASGLYPSMSSIDKFGVNLDITAGVANNDIWEGGGEYQFDAWGTAPIAYFSSSSAADTNIVISISGLDINGYEVVQTVTNNGQTVSSLPTPLWRIYRMENISNEGNDFIGMFYCHTNMTATAGVPPSESIRAIINDGNNQTLMAIYTIPKGKVGFLWRGEVGVEYSSANPSTAVEYAHVHWESRRLGKVFRVKKVVTCMSSGGSAVYQDSRSFPDVIPALTDIRIRSTEVSEDMGLFSTFDILLVDEEAVTDEFLTVIGQPE